MPDNTITFKSIILGWMQQATLHDLLTILSFGVTTYVVLCMKLDSDNLPTILGIYCGVYVLNAMITGHLQRLSDQEQPNDARP